MVTHADILKARECIAGDVVITPCRPALSLSDLLPGRVHLKLENLQRTGSFKERGVVNRLSALSPDERARGVVTFSAGNHAQALAYHAGRLGISATVVMPETAPLVKVTNTRRYGATVVLKGVTFSDAREEAERQRDEHGYVLIHAFNDELVVAGQGTIGLEILEQVPDTSIVVVPIGGGGLIGGIATAIKAVKPSVRIFGVEADAAPSARASRDAGRIVDIVANETLADGIAVKRVGEVTFPLIEKHVEDIVVVSEEEIASSILVLLEKERTVAEGAAAASLAAVLTGRVPVGKDDDVVLNICGGNIDVNMIARIIERGLVFDGRLVRLMVKVRDRPGSLARLTAAAARLGANVLEIAHRRSFADISVGDVEIVMHLETRGGAHVEEIIADFQASGLQVEEDA